MLDEAGYARGAAGVRFKVTYDHRDVIDLGWVEIVAGYWKEIGVEVRSRSWTPAPGSIGIYSAIRQYTVADYAGRSVAIIGLATPNFWLALLVIIYPAIWWGWTPPIIHVRFGVDPLANLTMFLFPALILGTYLAASTMRMTRTMMLEVLRQDYVRTAWAKGLQERRVVLRPAVKSALIPVVTLVGLQLPIIAGGSVIIETIFNLPGLGRLVLGALNLRDYPVVSGVNLFFAAVVGVEVEITVMDTGAWVDRRARGLYEMTTGDSGWDLSPAHIMSYYGYVHNYQGSSWCWASPAGFRRRG